MPVTYALPEGDTAGVPFVVTDNDTHFCPWDAAAGFFVLYQDRPEAGRRTGVYVWNLTQKSWDRVADLVDIPTDEWVGVRDATAYPLPLRLCRAGNGMISAVWDAVGT